MKAFLIILVCGLIGLRLLIPGQLSIMLLLLLDLGLFLFVLFLLLWLVIFNLGQVKLNLIILLVFMLANLFDILFHRLGC